MPVGDGTILRAAVGGALKGVAGRFGIPVDAVPAITTAVVTQVQADPKMVNATNQEPLRQSGVMWGGGLTTAAAIAIVAAALAGFALWRSG